jgi:catechol 2,3-dioxygenase-like lactoylglutathione lyase family enzyme
MNLGRFELCLQVADIERSLGFYTKLGFHPVASGAEHGVVVIRSGDCRIGLRQGHIAENLLNFRGGNMAEIAREAKASGLEFEKPPFVGGMAAWVLSCEGPTGMPSILSPILRNKANKRLFRHKIWISN